MNRRFQSTHWLLALMGVGMFAAPASWAAPETNRKLDDRTVPHIQFAYPNPTRHYLQKTAPRTKPGLELTSPVQGGLLAMDLDRDGTPEVIACESQKGLVVRSKTMNWRFNARVGRSIPTVGDLDGDKENEIFVASCTTEIAPRRCSLHILSLQGKHKESISIPGEIRGAIVLRDLDGDKHNELIFATQNGKLVVLERDGKMRTGFPKDLGGSLPVTESIYTPSPAVGELDGRASNGREIVAVSTKGQLHVFHADGTSLPAFPMKLNEAVFASPSLGDFDGDGAGEILVTTAKGNVLMLTPNGSMKQGFPYNVRGQVIATPVWLDLNRDGTLDLFVGTQAGFVYGLSPKGKLLPGWPRKVNGPITASLLAADITTNAKQELVVVTQSGSLYVFQKWGQSTIGYPVHTGQTIYATPVVTDLDNDGRADFLLATHSQKIFIFEDLRQGDSRRFVGGVSFRGTALKNAGALTNVHRESDLTPRSVAPQNTETPTTPAPSPTEPPVKSNAGCSTLNAPTGSLSSLLLLGLLFLVSRQRKPKHQL